MKLLSVNVSLAKEIPYRGRTVTTGIFKEPVNSRVMLRALNLDGDQQADLKGHGGIYKAVYVYSIENYDYWKRELGRTDFAPAAQFGENFTVEGMRDDDVHVGDVFRVGGALVEVTQPRVPCFKLGIKMGAPQFVRTFLNSCWVGFYLRVLEEGEVGAGDLFERTKMDPERLTIRKMCHLLYFDPGNVDGAQQALRIAALSPGWRGSFEAQLSKAGVAMEYSEEPKEGKCCGP